MGHSRTNLASKCPASNFQFSVFLPCSSAQAHCAPCARLCSLYLLMCFWLFCLCSCALHGCFHILLQLLLLLQFRTHLSCFLAKITHLCINSNFELPSPRTHPANIRTAHEILQRCEWPCTNRGAYDNRTRLVLLLSCTYALHQCCLCSCSFAMPRAFCPVVVYSMVQ
jgi:hypothetical protein